MLSQTITAGARFGDLRDPASYVVERVITADDVNGVQALVRFTVDGGTDLRTWEYGVDIPLSPAPPATGLFLAVHLDAAGTPRAWGVAGNVQDATAVADRELKAYRASDSDRSGQEPYRLQVGPVDL